MGKAESGALHGTVGSGRDHADTYDFGARALLVVLQRQQLGIPEHDPTPGGPWTLKVEPTPVCDIHCHTCPYGVANQLQISNFIELKRQGLAASVGLPIDTVMGILEDIERGGNTRGIHWSGGGEPLIWPHILPAIKRSAEFAKVSIQTNGNKLDRLMADTEALRAVQLMSVSIYGDSDETYRQVTGVGAFSRVRQNVQDMVALRNKLGLSMTINAKILVTPRNYQGLFRTLETFRGLGVDTLSIRETQNYNIGSQEERAESVELTEDQKSELLGEIENNWAQDNLLARFGATLKRGSGHKLASTTHCFNAIHSHTATVNPEGEVYLGDPESGLAEYCIGNVVRARWSQVWGSPRHKEVVSAMDRKQQLGHCPLDLCRHHIANTAVDNQISSGRAIDIDPEQVMENFGAFL